MDWWAGVKTRATHKQGRIDENAPFEKVIFHWQVEKAGEKKRWGGL